MKTHVQIDKINIGLIISGGVLQSVAIPESQEGLLDKLWIVLADEDNDEEAEDGSIIPCRGYVNVEAIPDDEWLNLFSETEDKES